MKTYDWTYHDSDDLGTEDSYYSLDGTSVTIQVCYMTLPGEPQYSLDQQDDDGLISHHGMFRSLRLASVAAEALAPHGSYAPTKGE